MRANLADYNTWEELYEDLKKFWIVEDRDYLKQAHASYKEFARLLRKDVITRNLVGEKLCKEILKDLKKEMEDLDARIRDLLGVPPRNIRFISVRFGKDGRRTGDATKNVANVVKSDLRPQPRAHVRYRRADQSGKINASHANGDGRCKARV